MVQKKYPYVPNITVFDKVLKLIYKSGKVPTEQEILDNNEGITKIKREANSTLSVLQRIGIIGDKSNITDLGKKLRLQGPKKKEAYNELLKSHPGFSELIQIMKNFPGDFPRVEIENHLLLDDVGSKSARSKIISFFRYLLKSADIENLLIKSQQIINEDKIKDKGKTQNIQIEKKNSFEDFDSENIEKSTYDKDSKLNMEDKQKAWKMQFLKENLSIEINEKWDLEKIKLLFDRLEKILKT